jgi:predicted RNA binding protein YcfA (HicA-like mRNA interferase family)
MTRLPIVGFKTMERILIRLGFEPIRQHGSHVFYKHPDGRTTTLPNHAGRDLARPLIRVVLREIDVSPDQYNELLKEI